jgi:methionyl-tRNA formyltransferase
VNLHASRLPKLRGAAPINWAILRGETTTGNSIIRLAQKMDAGAVLAQSEVRIGELETAGELHDRLAEDGGALLLGVLDALAAGKAVETPQDESAATVAPKLNREAARLDWGQSAADIARRIRGLHPWPGCHVRLLNEAGVEQRRLTLVRARDLTSDSANPGIISSTGLVGAGDSKSVEILEVQPEGKRPMPLGAYRNGHPWQPGWRLESV